MAQKSGFMPYLNEKQEYKAEDLALVLESLMSNGIRPMDLQVVPGIGMNVILKPGRAWINGYWYVNDDELTIPIELADGVLNRKDNIVLRYSKSIQETLAYVVKGSFASTPAAPPLTRTGEDYELKLAEINVPRGATQITATMITDTRLNPSVCGLATYPGADIDTSDLYDQIKDAMNRFENNTQADIMTWLQTIKDIMDDNAAVNLKLLIDALALDVYNKNVLANSDFKYNPRGITTNTASGYIFGNWYKDGTGGTITRQNGMTGKAAYRVSMSAGARLSQTLIQFSEYQGKTLTISFYAHASTAASKTVYCGNQSKTVSVTTAQALYTVTFENVQPSTSVYRNGIEIYNPSGSLWIEAPLMVLGDQAGLYIPPDPALEKTRALGQLGTRDLLWSGYKGTTGGITFTTPYTQYSKIEVVTVLNATGQFQYITVFYPELLSGSQTGVPVLNYNGFNTIWANFEPDGSGLYIGNIDHGGAIVAVYGIRE